MNILAEDIINKFCLNEPDHLPLAEIIHSLANQGSLPTIYRHYPQLPENLQPRPPEY